MEINPKFPTWDDKKTWDAVALDVNFIGINGEGDRVPFTDEVSFNAYVLAQTEPGEVYLISLFDRVFVSEDIVDIIYFARMMLDKCFEEIKRASVPVGQVEVVEVFIQEYQSFESAYRVALDMMEVSESCYDPE
jgi:hypothetical protein